MDFGNTLKETRKKKGYSQQEIAGKLNVTRQTISRWENNRGYPDTYNLLQIEELLEISLITNELLDSNKINTKVPSFYGIFSSIVAILTLILVVFHCYIL